jgi:hypothetical protein
MLLGAVSSAAAAVDEFFNRVTLLLPGNGTNGAQNNTFLDSSSNNFTITRNGNTTQGSFSPFSQTGWSNYFSASGTYLTATQSAFAAAGDFTVEAWFWQNNQTAGFQGIVSTSTSGNSSGFRITTDNGTLTLWVNNSSVTSASVPQNQWNHVAISRTGTGTNNISCYLNGVRVGQFTNTSSTTNTTLTVGRYYYDLANYYIDGYISNVRLVVGSGLYSGSTISVPTTPLTAVSGTQVLTCQSNRFIDSSSNAFALTINGTPSVQAFSPFYPTAAYTPQTIGGSGFFDGTTDYLSVPASSQFLPGANTDFTFEAWVYLTATPSAQGAQVVGTGEYGTNSDWNITINSSRQPFFFFNVLPTGFSITSSTAINLNSWNHIAVTRSGTGANNLKMFLNGVNVAQASRNDTMDYTGNNLSIGADENGDEAVFTGYISGLRLINGTGYTSISVPTAPPTNITNTVLLLNFTNAGIVDSTAKNVLETVGNAQISTAQSKFGGSSMLFDGTGDYLLFPSSELVPFASNERFTIEGWIYPTVATAGQIYGIYTTRNSGSTSQAIAITLFGTPLKINVEIANSASASVTISSSTTISANTWYHFAVVHDGTQLKLYVNGTSEGTPATTSIATTLKVMTIGRYYVDINNYYFNGYIDDLRITKGFARYTANFTPPTAAFPLQ